MATLGTFTAGQILTAAELNAISTFTPFTPTWTNLTVGTGGNALNEGQFTIVNKIMYFRLRTVLGTSGFSVATATLTVPDGQSLEVSPDTFQIPSIMVAFGDPGVANYLGIATKVTATSIGFNAINAAGTYATTVPIGATVPFTWGAGDRIEVSGWVQIV
jgi:hypothetical protein